MLIMKSCYHDMVCVACSCIDNKLLE